MSDLAAILGGKTSPLEQGPSTFYPGETRSKCPSCGAFELKGVTCAACYQRICPDCGAEMRYKGAVEPSDSEGRGGSDLYQCPQCKNVEVV